MAATATSTSGPARGALGAASGTAAARPGGATLAGAPGTARGPLAAAAGALPPLPRAESRGEPEENPLEGMTGLQRVAAFLIGIGQEASTKVLKHLPEGEIERVTLEIFRMRHVSARVIDAVMEEVYEALVAADYISSGGLEFAQELLTRTLGPQRASELIARLSTRIKAAPFDFLSDMDPMQIVSFLQSEHPQTIALVISYLQPEQAATVLSGLHPDLQSEVAMRVALMDRTAPDVVKEVERLLRKKVSSVSTQGYQTVGGVKHIVSVLNNIDLTTQKAIMDALDETRPELADELKKNMFTFEDIVRIGDRDMPRIVRELDARDLALALRGASEEVRAKFFRGMSSRAAAQLKEDMEILGPQRLSAVEDAQQKIVAVIRRLEQAEEITISRGGKDEFV
jgi:flagellar motor switch protein FliG